MTISASVEKLSNILAKYVQETTNDPVLVSFIDVIATMPVWAEQWNLPEWEDRIQHHEINWEERESAKDKNFLLALEIFELGRYNMYTNINEEETKMEYNRIRDLLKSTISCDAPADSEFDFGVWSSVPFG